MYRLNTFVNYFVDDNTHRLNMTHIVAQKTAPDDALETDLVIPAFNPSDSIFRKLANKENFSPDEVYKVVTAIEKKEASKKMIETFTANLKQMAEEASLKEEAKKFDVPVPPVKAGKNAYEIRADVLQMAIDWSRIEEPNKEFKKSSDEELLTLARKFYAFVENRRY
jgi:hypothetical protein